MRAIDLYENNHKEEIVRAWSLIQRDCQPFLLESNNKPLYRGINDLNTVESRVSFTKLTVHQERIPRDTNPFEHEYVIKAMKDAGFNAHRGNSIFCQASTVGLYDYGEVYVIFPIGDFNVTWSNVIVDWTEDGNIY